MRATYSPSTCEMHHMSWRHGLSSFSAKRRRTVSGEMLPCTVSRTSSSANSSKVQRARPAGGREQAVSTSRASSLPDSFRRAPGRGSSLSAASRLPEHKPALGSIDSRAAHLDARGNLLVGHSGIGRQQNLRPLELAYPVLCWPAARGFDRLARSRFLCLHASFISHRVLDPNREPT
jgi:hypothetical protein